MMPHIGSFDWCKFKYQKISIWDSREINSVGTEEKNCLNFLQTEKEHSLPPLLIISYAPAQTTAQRWVTAIV